MSGIKKYICVISLAVLSACGSNDGGNAKVTTNTPSEEKSPETKLLAMNHDLYGRELWITNGTADGTKLLADTTPGEDSGLPISDGVELKELAFRGKYYFKARTGLWVTDGTSEGTKIITDSLTPLVSSSEWAKVIGDKFYFVCYSSDTGYELCASDGTASGTQLLKDIYAGDNDSEIQLGAELDGKLFFSANDNVYGRELWVTDGTAEGTKMVKDINLGADASSPNNIQILNSNIVFQASDSLSGNELWVSDGTADGTHLLKDIYLGAQSSSPADFIFFKDELYFVAESEESGRELWKTDGTTEGTILFKDFNRRVDGDSKLEMFTVLKEQLFFYADTGGKGGRKLWVSNGSADPEGGTRRFLETNLGDGDDRLPEEYIIYKNLLIFYSSGSLFVTDGTEDNKRKIEINVSGESFTGLENFRLFNDKVYFNGFHSEDVTRLWETDGITAKPVIADDEITEGDFQFTTLYQTENAEVTSGLLLRSDQISVYGVELFVMDKDGGISLVKDVNPGSGGSLPLR